MSAPPRPAYPVLEDIGGGSEFSRQGIVSFVVPYFHRMYVQQIWKIREQVFLLAGRQDALVCRSKLP